MPFSYYQRLSARHKRVYRESDRVTSIRLHDSAELAPAVESLASALETGNRAYTERAAQRLCDVLTGALRVPALRVTVLERRPSWSTGELHGLYRPEDRGVVRVKVWMRTAQRNQVVKFRTFLRTLLHEVCHHLDYELLRLQESFHTEGFYKRESSLFHQLVGSSGAPLAAAGARDRAGDLNPADRNDKISPFERPRHQRRPMSPLEE